MPVLARLDLFHVAIPLRTTIRHASHKRASSDSLVVRATLDDGSIGYGEGVPRPYVTGEAIATAVEALTGFDAAAALGRPRDMTEAVERLGTITLPSIAHDPRGMFGNAARS